MIGGILAEALQLGQQVICITATKGEAGTQDESRWPSATLGDVRAQELAAALTILGSPKHCWIDYPDGGCEAVDEHIAISRLVELIATYKPDSVITFGPDGLTGHPDHQTVSRWAKAAVQQSDHAPQLYYAVHTSELYDQVFRDLDERLDIYINVDVPELQPTEQCDVFLELSKETIATKLRALQIMPSQYEGFFTQCTEQELALAFGSEALVCAK